MGSRFHSLVHLSIISHPTPEIYASTIFAGPLQPAVILSPRDFDSSDAPGAPRPKSSQPCTSGTLCTALSMCAPKAREPAAPPSLAVRIAFLLKKTVHFKHQPTTLSCVIGSLATLGGLKAFEVGARQLVPSTMLYLGSFAALSTLLFAAPAAPLGLAWNTFGGHCLSIGVAVSLHWFEVQSGYDLMLEVVAPSLAIGLMAKLQVINPPAAAAAAAFASTPLAQRQAFGGAFFLVCPALVGCAWALLVQWAVARTLTSFKRHDTVLDGPVGCAPSEPIVTVRCVRHATAVCIAQAVEGAAYVDDPLTYIIESLAEDRDRNLQYQRLVVSYMKESHDKKLDAVIRVQQAFRGRALRRRVATRATQKLRAATKVMSRFSKVKFAVEKKDSEQEAAKAQAKALAQATSGATELV